MWVQVADKFDRCIKGCNLASGTAQDKLKALEAKLNEERAYRQALEQELEAVNQGLSTSLMSQQRFTEHLEQLVRQRTQDAAKARDEALAASKAKSEFLATMSHEIRTPMNAIVGFTQLLLQSELTEKQRKQVANIDVSSRNLLQIINDILDFSKIEAGKLDLENVDFNLYQLCDEVETIYGPQAKQKGLALSFVLDHKIPPSLFGDSLRINQVITNLISNALKFTSKGSITLMARVINQRDDVCELEFSCQDTGVGILPEHQEKLFSAFTQADGSTTRQYGGTGLGLSICKKLIEKMDGRIWVTSQVGHGSTFYFQVPLKISESADDAPQKTEEPSAGVEFAALNVLLVEDNEINQELALDILKNLGVKADLASNGLEALERIKIRDYDLVFMDVQMPLMDGLQTTQRIRQDFADQELFVVAMTANASNEDRRNCLAAGMNEFISKPISISAISHMLNQRRQQLDQEKQPVVAEDDSDTALTTDEVTILDAEAALQRMGNRQALYQKMLTMFADKYGDSQDQLLAMIEAEDWAKAAQYAHEVKGVLANIAAEESCRVISAIDGEFKAAQSEQRVPDLTNLISYCLDYQECLARLRAAIDSYPGNP